MPSVSEGKRSRINGSVVALGMTGTLWTKDSYRGCDPRKHVLDLDRRAQ